MSKVTMPEHWVERIAEGTAVDFWWQNGTKGIKVGEKLITTDQAKAYADARVREALEAAEDAVTTLYEADDGPFLVEIARVICTLMPKEDI